MLVYITCGPCGIRIYSQVFEQNCASQPIVSFLVFDGLINNARKSAVLIEVKSGETFNGTLHSCDIWMNAHLVDVIKTSPSGDQFWKMSETFIKGSSIKYVRLPEDVLDEAKEHNRRQKFTSNRRTGSSGSIRGRGRGHRGRGSGTVQERNTTRTTDSSTAN